MGTTILEEQTFTGFSDGNLIELDSPAPLAEGQTYSITWDSEVYSCVAYASAISPGAIALGNMELDEWIGNGATGEQPDIAEPFLIMYGPASLTGTVDLWAIQCSGEECTSDTHTVAVYQEDGGEITPSYAPNDVTIKRYSGDGEVYEDVNLVYLTHASGEGKVPFSYGRTVENIPIELYLADGDQVVTADEGILVKSAVISKPADLSPENVRYGKDIAGVIGEFLGDTETATVEADFSLGNQTVRPSAEGKVLSMVTIRKPATLREENIAEGVTVAGITGIFKGGGGSAEDMPQLYAATGISWSTNTTGRKYFTVTNPYLKNGYFPEKLQLLAQTTDGDYIVLGEKELSTTTSNSSITVYATDYNQGIMMMQAMVRFAATGFLSSDVYLNSSTIQQVSTLEFLPENITLSGTYAKAFTNETMPITLTPASGYYLPKTISATGINSNGNTIELPYEYDPDNNLLTLSISGYGAYTIAMAAVTMPWLKDPVLSFDAVAMTAAVEFTDPNAEQTMILNNGEPVLEIEDQRTGMKSNEVTPKVSGASYGFTLTSGYYKSPSSSYMAAVARIDFDMATAGTVTLYCHNYAYTSTYYKYHYGIIGKVDCTLSTSYGTDSDTSSSNVLCTFANCGSYSYATNYDISVPAGKHFIYVKYVSKTSTYASYSYFQFKVTTSPAAYTVYSLTGGSFDHYGAHLLQMQSTTEGYTPSDLIYLGEYTANPEISIAEGILSLTNAIPDNVTAFELYIDSVLYDTVVYEGEGRWTVDLTSYSTEDIPIVHSVYVVGLGDGVAENQSEIVQSYLKWYTIDWYDEDGTTLLKSDLVEHNTVPEYEPTKEGYAFVGWTTEPAAATGNASYTAQWVEKYSFAEATWEYIASISERGLAKKLFAVGDTKTILYNSSTSITVAIADFDADTLSDGSGKAGITIVALNTIPVSIAAYSSSYYGYYTINSALTGTVMPNLPADLTAVIKTVQKKYDTSKGSTTSNVVTGSFAVWAPSIEELGITSTAPSNIAVIGELYELFKRTSITIREAGVTSGYINFWTRSTRRGGYSWPIRSYINGATKYMTHVNSSSTYYYPLIAFCV